MVDARRVLQSLAHGQPVRPVVAEVVAGEGLHRHRVAAQHARLADGGGGGLGGDRGADQHAVAPVACFVDERCDAAATTAEHDGRERHAARAVGLGGVVRVLLGRHREARVRVRGRAVGRIVGAALPVDDRLALVETFPPRLVVGGERDIGEQRVAADHLVGVAVGLRVGAGHHAEVTRLGVDRVETAVRAGVQPGDVIAHGRHLPAGHRTGRDQHREVGLAAGRGERGGDIVSLALRARQADDEHVLGEPTLVARLIARDAQRVALLAEQRVAAVAAAEALDGELLGEVHDEAAVRVELAGRVQSLDELAALAGDALERRAAGARHQDHVDDHICTIGDLDTAARVRRVDGAHAVGHHIERAALHAALEELAHLGVGLGGRHPMVVRTGVFLVGGADEGQVFDACDIRRMRAGEEAVGEVLVVELLELAARLQLGDQLTVLRVRPLDPMQLRRLRQLAYRGDPLAHGG